MRTVSEVMQTQIIYVSPTASLLEIAQIMAEKKISSIAIAHKRLVGVRKAVYPIGIITAWDIVRFQALKVDLGQIKAKKAMNVPLFCLRPTDSLWKAHLEMQRRNSQQLIVVGDEGELVGVVNQNNLLQLFDAVEIALPTPNFEQKLEQKTARLRRVNQQLENEINQGEQRQKLSSQASIELEKHLAQRTAELIQINRELSTTLEEQAVLEEELRQQNEELSIANENARLLEQRYEDLFEFAPNAYLVTDVNGIIQEVNRAAEKLFCLPRIYLIGKPIFVFIAEPHRRNFLTQVNLLQPLQNWECCIEVPKYKPFDVIITMTSVYDFQGKLLGKRLMIREIGEDKQTQKNITQQAALLDITTDAIVVCNLDKQILLWNRGAESLYEWLEKQAKNQNIQELLHPNNSSQFESALKGVLEENSWQGELQQVTKNGKQIVSYSRFTLMRDEQSNPKSILIVNTDITEKKQLEAQYYRAQRLESLGTLASGIAHDLNNILTPILTGTQLLQLKLPHLDERNKFLLKMLEDNSKRGAQLVKQITSFASGAEEDRVRVQLVQLINEISRIIESSFPVGIEFSTDISTQLWTIQAQPTQIHQLLMNLCINARDAMPEGGTLTIKAENKFIDQSDISINPEAKVGDYVAITITDTGYGIPQDILERIFEPFFTTKQAEKGTGLGLATVISIVKSHGGFINISSQVNQGSKFQVYLPASG
ncbi:PAS domain S-box protein [Calothrix sp. CCY 0018]|uniref:PAS domain S-box protein n=1 Tax=Calothrix sp. CCY 0018 TaxID=3103864 RepID=UPI0039C6956A